MVLRIIDEDIMIKIIKLVKDLKLKQRSDLLY